MPEGVAPAPSMSNIPPLPSSCLLAHAHNQSNWHRESSVYRQRDLKEMRKGVCVHGREKQGMEENTDGVGEKVGGKQQEKQGG